MAARDANSTKEIGSLVLSGALPAFAATNSNALLEVVTLSIGDGTVDTFCARSDRTHGDLASLITQEERLAISSAHESSVRSACASIGTTDSAVLTGCAGRRRAHVDVAGVGIDIDVAANGK